MAKPRPARRHGNLLDLGHRRIGLISGRLNLGLAGRRLQAFREVMSAAGLYDPSLVRSGNYTRESGRIAGAELLALNDRPTAIFAGNDNMAIGVMTAAGHANARFLTILSGLRHQRIDGRPPGRRLNPDARWRH